MLRERLSATLHATLPPMEAYLALYAPYVATITSDLEAEIEHIDPNMPCPTWGLHITLNGNWLCDTRYRGVKTRQIWHARRALLVTPGCWDDRALLMDRICFPTASWAAHGGVATAARAGAQARRRARRGARGKRVPSIALLLIATRHRPRGARDRYSHGTYN